jgi:CheY-like chemotaxis protein
VSNYQDKLNSRVGRRNILLEISASVAISTVSEHETTSIIFILPPIPPGGCDRLVADSDSATNLSGVTVLVVDDEKEVADAYALRLRNLCEVTTAYSGREALDTVERETVDVVLLDRRMPEMSGDEVLERLDDREFHGRVVMLTAIDPGFDVLDLPFDDYLRKPVEREGLRTTIDHHRRVLAYELLGEYFSAESKRAVLASELPVVERDEHDGFGEIEARVTELESRIRRLLGDSADLLDSFGEIDRNSV